MSSSPVGNSKRLGGYCLSGGGIYSPPHTFKLHITLQLSTLYHRSDLVSVNHILRPIYHKSELVTGNHLFSTIVSLRTAEDQCMS